MVVLKSGCARVNDDGVVYVCVTVSGKPKGKRKGKVDSEESFMHSNTTQQDSDR